MKPIVYITQQIVTCPECGASQIFGTRGGPLRQLRGAEDQGDGSRRGPWRCQCGARFDLVMETPDCGGSHNTRFYHSDTMPAHSFNPPPLRSKPRAFDVTKFRAASVKPVQRKKLNPLTAWRDAIEQRMKIDGISRAAATARVAKDCPTLRAALVAHANQKSR